MSEPFNDQEIRAMEIIVREMDRLKSDGQRRILRALEHLFQYRIPK